MQKILFPTLLSVGLLSSCATILSDSEYPVTFNTNPEGGAVTITDVAGVQVYKGPTPTTITLPAGDGYFDGQTYAVEASLSGFDPVNVSMESTMDGWYLGNILFGGLIGLLIVDPATGAMWKLEDNFLIQMDGTQVELVEDASHADDD